MSAPAREGFWNWSLERYRRKGVEPILLHLQDDFGFNVNIALWCCWCAEFYEQAPELVLRNAVDRTDKWNTNVTGPLRAVRRFLKPCRPSNPENDETFRARIKEAELAAEKEEQLRLEALAETALSALNTDSDSHSGEQRARARRNLAAYAALIGAAKRNTFSVSLLETLVDQIFASAPQKPANGDNDDG